MQEWLIPLVDKRVGWQVKLWSLVNTCQLARFRDEYRTHYKALYKCPVYLVVLKFHHAVSIVSVFVRFIRLTLYCHFQCQLRMWAINKRRWMDGRPIDGDGWLAAQVVIYCRHRACQASANWPTYRSSNWPTVRVSWRQMSVDSCVIAYRAVLYSTSCVWRHFDVISHLSTAVDVALVLRTLVLSRPASHCIHTTRETDNTHVFCSLYSRASC